MRRSQLGIWGLRFSPLMLLAFIAAADAPDCNPDLPFMRPSVQAEALACIKTLWEASDEPLAQAFWKLAYAAEEAVATGDQRLIARRRRALEELAQQQPQTVYSARALVHAADLTWDVLRQPFDAVPMYRDARTMFEAHAGWPPVHEHLAYIDLREGEIFLELRTYELALRHWEAIIEKRPQTRAARNLPMKLATVYDRWRPPAEAFEKTLRAYDAVLEGIGDASEERGRLALERLDVLRAAVRSGLAAPGALEGAARAVLEAFQPGDSVYIDLNRERIEGMVGIDRGEAEDPAP